MSSPPGPSTTDMNGERCGICGCRGTWKRTKLLQTAVTRLEMTGHFRFGKLCHPLAFGEGSIFG
jgi:hypothetical protein